MTVTAPQVVLAGGFDGDGSTRRHRKHIDGPGHTFRKKIMLTQIPNGLDEIINTNTPKELQYANNNDHSNWQRDLHGDSP